MQGLVWGLYRLDRSQADISDIERLTEAISADASIDPAASIVIGPVVLARADLRPNRTDPGAASVQIDFGKNSATALDCRLYSGADQDSHPLAVALQSQDQARLAALQGDFVAAHWDQDTHQLLLCRDGLGIRPLFFVHRPGRHVVFCSLPRPLIRAGFAIPDKDADTIVQTMTANFQFGTQTLVRDVQRVPAGHIVKFQSDRKSIKRFGTRRNCRPCPPQRTPIKLRRCCGV